MAVLDSGVAAASQAQAQRVARVRDMQRRGWLKWASVVDHIVPINAGGDPFPGLDGLRSLCASLPQRQP